MHNEQLLAQLAKQLDNNAPGFKRKLEESKLIVRWAMSLLTAVVIVVLLFDAFKIPLSPDTFFAAKRAISRNSSKLCDAMPIVSVIIRLA